MQSTQKYNSVIRILHWLMALIIFGLIGLGIYMSDLPKGDVTRDALYALHKSFGALIILLFATRLIVRSLTKAPKLPDSFSRSEVLLANLGHKLLYVFMFLVPISGYAMSNFYGYGINMFGLNLPNIVTLNKDMGALAKEAHEILPYILLGIIGLHVAAALKHRFFDAKDKDVLDRML